MQASNMEGIITEEIRAVGPITFARFMELALYHPEYGYYGSGSAVIGKRGDFYTSSHATAVYGRMVAEVALALSSTIGTGCTFVEMGAGEGLFARDFLGHLGRYHKGHDIKYVIIENSPGMEKKQRECLHEYAQGIRWYRSVDELPGVIDGIFFSNELLDAFPFHMVKQETDALKEVYIASHGGGLTNELGTVSTGLIPRYFNRLQLMLEPGMTTEVNLNALEWVRQVSRKLRKGYVITVDYGYPANEYYSPSRPKGTFLCYHEHKTSDNPLLHIGEQDITAHVDFTSVSMVGKNEGLDTLLFTYQSPFLIRAAALLEAALAGAGQDEMTAVASGIRNLIHPDILGSTFMVLVQGKGVSADGTLLDGIRDYSERLL
jgi:SAM-dependent MidA family methyltransferase